MAGIIGPRTVVSASLRRFIGTNKTRSYGCAAAQVQNDYDSCEDDEEMSDRFGRRRRLLDMEGSVSGRGVQWVVIGDPGAKKHVYAERLSKLLEVPHISMGSLVRQELNPLSSLYKQIANAVNQGKLVPEDIIFGLLTKRLEEGYCRGESGFILDGIPRTRMQAEILDQIADVDLVVNLKCNEEHLVNKHIGPAAAPSHWNFHAMHSSVSNVSTLNLLKPNDKHQFDAEQKKPLEEYYREQQKLLDFKMAGPPGETWKGLLVALHLQHVDADNSTQKLTA